MIFHHFTHVYQKLWSYDVQFLRYEVRKTDGPTDGQTEKVTYRGECPNWKYENEISLLETKTKTKSLKNIVTKSLKICPSLQCLPKVNIIVGNKKIFFGTTRRILENVILGKKYFRAWHYTTHTNYHWEMFFLCLSQTWLGYGIEIDKLILVA